MSAKRKAFITGITGQDGSYLAEILLEKGYEVYGMIRRSSSFNTARIDHIFNDVELVFGDLSDGSSLNQLMRRIRPDEVGDPHDLSMELRVNGEVRQSSNMSRMSGSVPEILAHYSPLGFSAGDVLSLGTVSGVAGFSDDPASLYLKPGDVVEAEIERIGVLRNPVVGWEEAHGEPAPAKVRW